jgi:hypothetical protein
LHAFGITGNCRAAFIVLYRRAIGKVDKGSGIQPGVSVPLGVREDILGGVRKITKKKDKYIIS